MSDSICKTYTESEAPLKGWGQYINLCFEEAGIKVDNLAEGGRSTKSFRGLSKQTNPRGKVLNYFIKSVGDSFSPALKI